MDDFIILFVILLFIRLVLGVWRTKTITCVSLQVGETIDIHKDKKVQQQKQKKQQKIQRDQPPRQQQITSKKGVGGGILGNLLGAQQRTDNHLDVVRTKRRNNDLAPDLTSGAAGVITSFREKVAADLEKFKSDNTLFLTKVSTSLTSW